jgi:hypothetical protein
MKLKTRPASVIAIGLLAVSAVARVGATVPTTDLGPWKKLAPPPRPGSIHQGLTAAISGKYLYVLFGFTGFWRYDTSTNTWEAMTSPPDFNRRRGTLHYPGTGNSIYYLVTPYDHQENRPIRLYRYSIPGNSWEALPAPPLPAPRGLGVALTSNGGSLYAMIGGPKTDFLRYSISTAEWAPLAPVPAVQRPNRSTLFEKASLVYPGSGAYIYAAGIYDAILWRYSIPLNRWDSLASPPGVAGAAGNMVYPGKGDYFYVVDGYDRDALWRYSISRNTWTTVGAAPKGVYVGGAWAFGEDNSLYTFMARMRQELDGGFFEIQCLASMTVPDEPVPSLPGPITAGATSTSGAVVTYETGAPVTCTPASGSVFPIGTTIVNCTAGDATGNTRAGSFTVSVVDNTAPSVRVPADIMVATSSPMGAVVTYEATATDLIDPHPVVSCQPASGSTFTRTRRVVTCTARDASGNLSRDEFTVTVVASAVSGDGPAAQVWLGVENREDVGAKFDLLAEVFCKGVLVGSGQTNDVSGGGRGFDNAVLRGITLALSGPLCPERDTSVRLSVRIADTSDRESGTARLWFNDWVADSRVALPFWGTGTRDWFLKKGRVLARASGYPPNPKKKTIDVLVRRRDGFRPFGTWTLKD